MNLIDKLNDVSRRVGRMCSEGRPPKMSIPARRGYDDDLFICDTMHEAKEAIEQAERVRTAAWDLSAAITVYASYSRTIGEGSPLLRSARDRAERCNDAMISILAATEPEDEEGGE